MVLISPQTEEHSLVMKKEKNLTMELLSDQGNGVAEKFGLAWKFKEDLKMLYLQFGTDLEKYNNDNAWRLPMPARYIIDSNRVIKYAVINPDYTIRPEPADTIEALKKLVG